MSFGGTRRFTVFSLKERPRRISRLNAMVAEKPSRDVLANADVPIVVGAASLNHECLYFGNKSLKHGPTM